MILPTKSLLLSGLLALPLLGAAQTELASPHFYLGAGANLLTDVPFDSAGAPRPTGPSLTAGVQFTPRLALQASVAYHWKNESFTTYSSPSSSDSYSYNSRVKYFTVPVLLRYTFTPPTTRFHVDGLAGVTLLHRAFHSDYIYTYASYPSQSDSSNSSKTQASITLGPAVRYSLFSHLEVTANGLVSALVGDTYDKFSQRLYLNVLVGAHYTFGQF